MPYIRIKPLKWRRSWPLHLMLLPGMALLFLFQYIPMIGIVIAFQDFVPTKGFFGSEWVGLQHFDYMLSLPDTTEIIVNTLTIAIMKIVLGLLVPIIFALLLNEIRQSGIKRSVQTMVYFPHFLSWVILGGILIDVLSMNGGAVNRILGWFGLGPYFFLGDPGLFRGVVVLTDVWKEFGFSTIIYLAALSGINPVLYEAAVMDGAGRWRQLINITLPGIAPIAILMATLSIGGILNAGFDQIFNLYSPLVYKTSDIIDTWVYRAGLIDMQYGLATAVGLLKSFVGMVLISISYWAASRFANYRIF
ncbi:ABC transporter permease [Cohnella fermenti]|uniref:Sugar ABC transporter permease n=1 Tax=Cohnella fermenti TaxID=2565925 RepID=A0A4S4BQ53_9BACL|nr:ABC transporter permease subunit [Cohnella fermenti]THF76217.1 sugar ABC transporter permease [Cohnella fermenti]